jgi:hypothetical protein
VVMQGKLVHLLICVVFIQHFYVGCPSCAIAQDEPNSYGRLIDSADDKEVLNLSLRALALAKALGILPVIKTLKKDEEENRSNFSDRLSFQILRTRQQLSDMIQYTTLQVKEVTAAIDLDIAETDRLLDYLSTRRDQAVKVNSVATFMTSGALSALNSALNLGGRGGGSTNVIGTISGGSSTLMPTYNIYSKRSRGSMAYRVHPNMLAPIFGFASGDETKFNSIIWTYLNSAPPGAVDDLNRREKLILSWRGLRGLPDPSTAAGKQRAAVLSGIPVPKASLTISLLDERSAMLTDVRAEVVRIFRDLSELKAGIMAI